MFRVALPFQFSWLNMYRNPESIFPSNLPVIQMSHSDFSVLDIDYEDEVAQGKHNKSYDFIYYMTNTEGEVQNDCTGWGSFAKNWPLAKQAMDIMCGEMDYTGVVMGIVDSHGNSCDLPPSCSDKVLKVQYANYFESLNYMRQSKILLLPQVYDASPRVAVEAMSLNLPLLMNSEIVGGWKYINEQTGEFFRNDMSDFRSSLTKLMGNLSTYTPRSYVVNNYGRERSGRELRAFVERFADRVTLPKRSELLIPSEPVETTAALGTAISGVGPYDTTQDSPETIPIESFVIGLHVSKFKDFVQANHGSEGEFNWVHGENGWDQRVADEWVDLAGGPALDVSTYKHFEKDHFGPHAAGENEKYTSLALFAFVCTFAEHERTYHSRLLHVSLQTHPTSGWRRRALSFG